MSKEGHLKRIRISTMCIIMASLLTLTFCHSVYGLYHKPVVVEQVDVVFKDSLGNCYANDDAVYSNSSLIRYDFSHKNHYRYRNFTDYNYECSASNGKYLFLNLWNSADSAIKPVLRICDVDFNVVNEFIYAEKQDIRWLVCNDNCLYVSIFDPIDNSCQLIKYYLDSFSSISLGQILENSTYIDDSSTLFIGEDYETRLLGSKTKFFTRSSKSLETKYLGGISLSISNKNILTIEKQNESALLKQRIKSNHFYEKSYLIGDKILFATYLYEKQNDCGYDYFGYESSGICTCGIKESYLYSFDLENNNLSLIKSFSSGTYLIDYDLENVSYYYNEKLYVNDAFSKDCESIKPSEYIRMIRNTKFRTSEISKYLYLSFYDSKFYGI